jgi:hypothetical protein
MSLLVAGCCFVSRREVAIKKGVKRESSAIEIDKVIKIWLMVWLALQVNLVKDNDGLNVRL